MITAGLPRLPPGELSLPRRLAAERNILLTRTAPHLVHTLPLLVPLHAKVSRRRELLLTAALRASDALRRSARTPSSVLPPPRRIPAAEALALAPGLSGNRLRGGLLAFDGQLVDDARLVIALARTAAGFGARVLPRVRIEALDRSGADAVDQHSGESFRIRARSVVNATGVWAAQLSPNTHLRLSMGTHLVIDADRAGLAGTAVVNPSSESAGQFHTLLPQQEDVAYLGTTEHPTSEPVPSVPEVPESDVDALLRATEGMLAEPLARADVLAAFSGVRAVVDGSTRGRARARSAWDRFARHEVSTAEGVVTVVGGGITGYRWRAAEAVDAAIRSSGLRAGPSRTADVPLVGAAARNDLTGLEAEPRLVFKYGTEALRLAALIELDHDLADPVAPGLTAVEVLWAIRHEGALDADDVLDRRSRVGLDPEARARAYPAVAELVERALQGVLTEP